MGTILFVSSLDLLESGALTPDIMACIVNATFQMSRSEAERSPSLPARHRLFEDPLQ